MKKILLSFLTAGLSLGLNAQSEQATEVFLPAGNNQSVEAVSAVNDTLGIPLANNPQCDGRLYVFGNYLFGTRAIGSGSITEVGQVMNTSDRTLDIYSLFFYTAEKSAGNNPGSFTASIYDSAATFDGTGSPAAVSQPVPFANIDTTNLVTVFTFSNPVSVDASFIAALNVDNGSDSVALVSTNAYCGFGGAFFEIADTAWYSYRNSFTNMAGDPLDASIFVFAEVDTAAGGIGLERNFIHRDGLNFYPNPASEQATIECAMNSGEEVTLMIQDMLGRTVYTEELTLNSNSTIDLNLSEFKAGTYTYQVIGKNKQFNGVFQKN